MRDGVFLDLLGSRARSASDLTTDAGTRLRRLAAQQRLHVGTRSGRAHNIDGEGSATQLYDGIEFANGIGFSPDGRTLYHSNYSEAYVLAHDGWQRPARRVFARVPRGNDGLAVDESARSGSHSAPGPGSRFAADGALLDIVDVPANFVTSLCFGGADRRDLYVTTPTTPSNPTAAARLPWPRSPSPAWWRHEPVRSGASAYGAAGIKP